jgi:hypothetical protein
MRRAFILLVAVGLFAASQGCNRTMRHTAGICDVNAPPVESLLVGPNPTHAANGLASGGYAPAPYATSLSVNGSNIHVVPGGNAPSTNTPPAVNLPKSSSESIKVLPKVEDK